MPIQPELITRTQEADVMELRGWLLNHGWQSRAQLCEGLGWNERDLRSALEGLGADVVRSQRGFKLTEQIRRDELGMAAQACDAALSQGKKQIRYALALRRRIHEIVG